MTKPPFGFHFDGSDDPDENDPAVPEHGDESADQQPAMPQNPFGAMFGFGVPGAGPLPGGGQGMGFPPNFGPGMDFSAGMDMEAMMPLLNQIQSMFNFQGGSVNWDLAKQQAVAKTTASGRALTRDDKFAVIEAVKLADLWLSESTAFPSGINTTQAWTRTEWVERTLPVWSQLCEPVAEQLVTAMSSLLGDSEQQELPEGFPDMSVMMRSMGGMMFGSQVGEALSRLAAEVLTGSDVGLPLGHEGTAVLLPQNIAQFCNGLEVEPSEITLYLALREAAYQRLFAHVPWLKQRLLDTVAAYARGITIDKDAIENAMSQINPEELQSNPAQLQEVLASGIFEPVKTEAQKQTLASLETLLALIEGWVDRVVSDVATKRLPGADAIGEMIRRRRAAGGPAEQTFATLVGLQMRPRRLRDAATLWAEVEKHRGVDGRDAIWEHPDLLPSSSDLDQPTAYADMTSNSSFTDDDFEALLRGDLPSVADPEDRTPGPDGESESDDDSGSGAPA
ncbi:MAG: zinc-dependent metalloprotease [Antricoccus sp.]